MEMIDRFFERVNRFFGRLSPFDRSASAGASLTAVAVRDAVISPDEEVLVLEQTDVLIPAKVILYNDEIHTFDEVIAQLVKATGCSFPQAENLALEVDGRGLAAVYQGAMDRCLRVSSVLEEIALHTSVEM